ncbi:MAG: EamA family transporter, partial [Lachnospiraceae bacterium]
DAWIAILYAGVFSCGVAYTLQIVGQNGLNPTLASMLMSLESVFSVLAGWLILHEKLESRQLIGCALIFAAIILAQLPAGTKKE